MQLPVADPSYFVLVLAVAVVVRHLSIRPAGSHFPSFAIVVSFLDVAVILLPTSQHFAVGIGDDVQIPSSFSVDAFQTHLLPVIDDAFCLEGVEYADGPSDEKGFESAVVVLRRGVENRLLLAVLVLAARLVVVVVVAPRVVVELGYVVNVERVHHLLFSWSRLFFAWAWLPFTIFVGLLCLQDHSPNGDAKVLDGYLRFSLRPL